MYPGGRQEGSRKVWGVRPRSRAATSGLLQTAEHDRGRHPLGDTAHKATEVEKARIRPGGSLLAASGMFMCFGETGPTEDRRQLFYFLHVSVDSLKEITPRSDKN